MKSKFWLIYAIAFLNWLESVNSANCNTPFQQVPYGSGTYCAKCDTTCATCSGSAINLCSTCPTDFVLNSNTSTCTPPMSTTINTIANMYHSFGFVAETSIWAGSSTYSCGTFTILQPSSSTSSLATLHSLDPHYQIRVIVAFWSLTSQSETLGLTYSKADNTLIFQNSSGGTVNSNFGAQSYQPTCGGAYAVNFEQYVNDSVTNAASVKVSFTSTAASWGINQYLFISYLCSQPDCASCQGPTASNCTSCSSSIKKIYTYPGTCQCSFQLGYYAYPTGNSTYYCVNPCPNLPSGQYYGDNFTKTCVLSCPVNSSNTNYWNLSFASDQHGFCVNICPTTITLGGTVFKLYYDLINRKCITQCPKGQPYTNPVDLACYTTCPINSGVQYYMLNTDMSCVAICPNITNSTNGVQVPLYRDPTTLTCAVTCPSGYWGYTNSTNGDRYCIINNCPTGSGQFTDNSTGRPLCTITCPAPNWFGDYYILPAACVTTCSFPYFGDQNDTKRFCVKKCNGSFYGIQSGTRQCVEVCPNGSWGQRLNLVCVTLPLQCNLINITFGTAALTGNYSFNPSISSFADNSSRMCIWANQSCSNSMFKLNTSMTCQLTCPSGTYANTITFWCVDICYGSYFGDPLLNKCVQLCSPGLYADIGSGNKCVSRCNQTGGYPYKDKSTRQCVKVCNDGYADPTAEQCVFNCTPGLYLNGSDSNNQSYKFCVYNCSSPYFAYNNTDTGICIMTCPSYPRYFGDVISGLRICVEVCQVGYYGDQVNTSYRHCVTQCQNNTFAQNDSSRLCVTRCNSSTYGRTTDWTCVDPQNCQLNYTGDPTTNMCVDWCPPSNGTFSDNVSKLCVSKCPIVNTTVYYADIHIRWCIPTCQYYSSSLSQFGNNSTQTCQASCLDNNSYADSISSRRYCIAVCTNYVSGGTTTLYYRNNRTMTCVISTGCPINYFGDNSTAYCVKKCSKIPNNSTNSTTNTTKTWGYYPTQTCVALCLPNTFGDDSSGIPLCVSLCAQFPVPKWSYLGPNDDKSIMLCMTVCPPPYFGQDFLRTCVTNCPRQNSSHNQTYSYDITRRCLLQCPDTTFADYIDGICYHYSINCTLPCWYTWTNCSSYRWGDTYNNSCTYKCTASPWDSYGDNLTQTCTINCSVNSYADNYTGTRTCIAVCPGYYSVQGVVDATKLDISGVPYDSYGDNYTQKCLKHCVMPSTYADWQTHLCTFRCTGDVNTTVPTYANIFTNRCVIALFCPVFPDLYFGQNITRWCQPSCPLNSTYVSFADNITRTCIPVCFQYTNASRSNFVTMFYGDKSTGRPACIIACPTIPRMFGKNATNLCVYQCPDYQYGDQTGNRSCVPVCPNINGVTWFSQLTQRICVLTCQDGTWGNYYNSTGPHCQTVGTDCKPGQFGDNSTHMCVDLCPQSMNYFGDPSVRLCTDRCPYLSSNITNTTANINLVIGRLFADYKTRLCVYTCPSDFGLQGTFGDNSTNTCVQRCPIGSYGDANTINRFCVANCTGSSFADPLSMLCVKVCPASPPYFGYEGNWTCLQTCPSNFWADSTTRKCTSSCSPNFRLSYSVFQCVSVCPSQPDLYADTNGYNCTPVCTNGQYADPTDRKCKPSCLPLFQYNYRCVKFCPKGFFANSTGDCVPPLSCDPGKYGDNSTTKCVTPCPAWSFADNSSGYCIAVCPGNTYGQQFKCVYNCSVAGNSYSNITQMCQSKCPNKTYSLQGVCVNNCTGSTYQNDNTNICDTSCPSGLFADPTTHRCVAVCPFGWFRQSTGANTGFCVAQINGCSPLFADVDTGNCVTKCSVGYWGFSNQTNSTNSYIGNYTCVLKCPTGMFGYESTAERTCYPPNGLPSGAPNPIFADTVSGKFVLVCPQIPILYYGDKNRQYCVARCQSFNLTANTPTLFYGDPQNRRCESTCTNTTYSADGITHLCTLRCTFGTFRYNITPICSTPCPVGYGDYSTRICVATCPITANTFGFYNATSGSRLCVSICPLNFYSQPQQRTCTNVCPHSTTKYYAFNDTRECLTYCPNSFAFDDTWQCVAKCTGTNFPNADNSTNKCVSICPSSPDYYSDSNVCVFFCTTPNYYADSNGRKCVSRCSNKTGYNQYGDPRTGRCEKNCSSGLWGDNLTNLCVSTCPDGSFADNTTGFCVAQCPKIQNIYADMFLHTCSYTCSNGYFGSQVNQTCIAVCDSGYWGDPTTTLCISKCPVKIYSYGQNVTRRCVPSCYSYSGYADNFSRLCRQYCQHTIIPQTYIDYKTLSCVQKCPQGTWAANYTAPNNTINQCTTYCPSGFADNYSQWCVAVCPSLPESYGDTHARICIYSCRFGQFSDNSTNLCVQTCPNLNNTPSVDYYGDNITGRCVIWCSEGTYAQNSSRLCVNPCPPNQYADNLTRRCVTDCPPSQVTFADSTTNRCVRICPHDYWAENTTQKCVPNCWTYPNGTVSYADNITNFCVAICPFDYFGTNSTHKCVLKCSATLDEYGHPVGRVCVGTNPTSGKVDCYGDNSTGIPYYGDPITRLCVQKCPLDEWANTHIFKCVTQCDSSFPQFRNNHTQMCVWPCPTDPDQYGDSTTGNCVRTCPNGYFAYVGNRTCLPSCGQFALFADNTTNRCVSSCATAPYFYADNLTWSCVFHCSGGQFADNRSQTCVSVCPSEWAYFGQTISYTCVSLCPEGQFADINAWRTCRSICTNSYFADNYTSTCVQHCSFVRPFWYEDTSLGYGVCVDVCPGQSYAYNPDQTCKYQNTTTLASTCPGSYYADRKSRQCVKLCPAGTFANINTKYCQYTCSGSEYADPILRKCVTVCSSNLYQYVINSSSNYCNQYCPSPYFAQNSTSSTSAQCVTGCTNLLSLPTTRTCETYCPHPYFAEWTTNKCLLNCTPNFQYTPNRTCLPTCQSPYYGNPLTFTCDLLCPIGYFGRNDTRKCDTGCPSISFSDPSIRICVKDCPSYPLTYADSRYNKCLPYCQVPLFGFEHNNTCVSSCPNITQGNKTLIYLADSSNRLCVLSCVNALISFADYTANQCTQYCPNGTFASNYTKQCLPVCPNDPNDTFSDNNSHICMDVCLPGSFGMSSKLNCVAQCWWPFYADPTTRRCVDFCPLGYFAQNSTATCRPTCPPYSYADPVTHRCLAQCPALQRYFNYAVNWTCTTTCPNGFFANTDTNTCESICNSSSGMFAYLPTNLCVRQCPIPYRGYAPNYTCVLDCPPLSYFYDVTINVCAQCDPTCIICSSLSTCLQCKSGYNLFNGYCGRNCIPTPTSITYADPSGTCVSVCPITYFGDNSTYSCTQTCPGKLYGDSVTRLCQNCPQNCATCFNLTYCITCETGATLAIDNMCYANCNSTAKYSFNGTCYNICPSGTYLTYTGVTCSLCSPICLTCFNSGSRCISCATTYFYNNTCLTTCPSGYYGSTTLQCLSCSGSSSAACTNPLNFSTSYSTQNFQPVITLQFNQNVTMAKNLSDILKINLQVTRRLQELRLLQIGTIVNNGITYTYQILNNGTIKLYPQVGTSLLNPTFSVQISDPASVTSASTGVSLQNVQSLLTIAALQYYSPSDGKQAGTNFPAKLITILVLLLFVISFIFSDVMIRPIQFLQIFFFHCLIAVDVPANIFYFLFQIKAATFDFVDNWFQKYLPKMSPYYSTPLKVADVFIDQIFLRHLGQIFVLTSILACFWFVFLILGNRRIVKHKIWQGFFAQVSQKRYQLMVINDIFSLFYFPVFYWAFMQFSNLFTTSGFYALNGVITLLLFIAGIIVPVSWFTLWKTKQTQYIQNRLWFLTIRVKSVTNQKQYVRVHYQKDHQQIKEKSSAHSGEIIEQQKPKKINSYLQSIVFMAYQLLMAIWMVSFYTQAKVQLVLMIITNIIFLLYNLKFRPQLNILNLIFTILSIGFLVGLQSMYLYFVNNNGLFTASQKTNISYPFLIAFDVFCVLLVLWVLWRFVWQVSFYWNNFKKTLLYLEFADHDYIGQQQKTQKFSIYQKKAQKLDVGLGDIVIDQIMEKVGPSGQKIIAVRKKRLRKKQKIQGRKKKNGAQLLPDEEELSQRQQYVRVNNLNIFDYNNQFDNEHENSEPEIQIIQPPKKRLIDDDIRDLISDNSEQIPRYYEEDEQQKKIDVQPDQNLIVNLQEISAVQDVKNSQKISDYPFIEVEQQQERVEQQKVNQQIRSEGLDGFYPIQQNSKIQSPRQPIQQKQKQDHLSQRNYQEIQSQASNINMYSNMNANVISKEQNHEKQVKQQIVNQQREQKPYNPLDSYNLQNISQDEGEIPIQQAPKIKGIEDLLQEEEKANKKQNLLFLFDDFDQQQQK